MRFLALYLGSVFVLLAIIGYLFFENNRVSMLNAIKYEMMYQGRKLTSEIAMEAMRRSGKAQHTPDKRFLRTLQHDRFRVGYFDERGRSLYSELKTVPPLTRDFSMIGDSCYTVGEDKDTHLGVRYVVLEENELSMSLRALRLKIIGYLIVSFLVMGAIGYLLGKLFLKPVRERIEALDRFIADTTHELNTPVSAILMTVHALHGVEEKHRRRLEASAKRLAMTYKTLTYRLEGYEEKEETFDLAALVRERVEYINVLLETKRLTLHMKLESASITMPRAAAERLVDNVLSNAVKYTDSGDTIRITLEGGTLAVEDTGIGMDTHDLRDIFKRYKRANRERGGFGLGLSIVADICERYGIALDVTSKKGEGSMFRLTFATV